MITLRDTLALAALAVSVPVVMGSLVACGAPSCRSQCDRSAALDCDKDGQPDNGGSTNCATFCADVEALNKASGCGSSFDAYMSCLSGIQDLCTGVSGCDAKLSAYSTCAQTYCASNPTDPACAAPI